MSKSGGSIPLYNQSPSNNILLDELETLTATRMFLLDLIEASLHKRDEKFIIVKKVLDERDSQIGWPHKVENDIASHFVLATAFCKTDQERSWFANLETKLFLLRLEHAKIDLFGVLNMLNIPLQREVITDVEFLSKVKFRNEKNNEDVYRIPFEYALNMLPTMQYFIHMGYIYITKNEISQIIETVFKENLLKKLNLMFKNINRITSDKRISYLISNIQVKRESNLYLKLADSLSKTFNSVGNENLSCKDIDSLADKTFPLCMQILHKNLTQQNHLKHFGRLQYGLFLKGIGLNMEESLNFWRNKFKNISSDKFEKEYSYNIRHSYGKEGKRNDYIPWNCTRVQRTTPPTANEYHGCPYQVYSEDKLKSLLFELKYKEIDVYKILEKKRSNEYSVCFCII
jgi:DNA primase large subunit